MKVFFSTVIGVLLLSGSLQGQDQLVFYCDVMANAYEVSHKSYAAQEFNKLFEAKLKEQGSFDQTFEALKWVSIKYDEAHTFRVITWQVEDAPKTYIYYGVIQTKDGQLYQLTDQSKALTDAEFQTLSADGWYGALYYNLIERHDGDKTRYFLFGYNGWDEDEQVKVIEELYFEDGKPYFGRESFVQLQRDSRPTERSRVVITYSDLANVNCNWNEAMQLIVYDYVTPKLGIGEGGKPVKIPDGTYVGYEWKDDKWMCIPQIAHEISTPESIFYQPKPKDDRDIIGRKNK